MAHIKFNLRGRTDPQPSRDYYDMIQGSLEFLLEAIWRLRAKQHWRAALALICAYLVINDQGNFTITTYRVLNDAIDLINLMDLLYNIWPLMHHLPAMIMEEIRNLLEV